MHTASVMRVCGVRVCVCVHTAVFAESVCLDLCAV